MTPEVIEGDLLDQDVEVIVNSWNRNIIPWWLLLPQGVSGAIKREGGVEPFKELAKEGATPLGEAKLTTAGLLLDRGSFMFQVLICFGLQQNTPCPNQSKML